MTKLWRIIEKITTKFHQRVYNIIKYIRIHLKLKSNEIAEKSQVQSNIQKLFGHILFQFPGRKINVIGWGKWGEPYAAGQ